MIPVPIGIFPNDADDLGKGGGLFLRPLVRINILDSRGERDFVLADLGSTTAPVRRAGGATPSTSGM
jgi:hypothetical protein